MPALDRHDLIFAVALTFTYFVLLKIADWLLGGFAVENLGPHVGTLVHAGIVAAALLAFVVRGVYRQRDRFSVLVGAAVLAIPAAVYLATAW